MSLFTAGHIVGGIIGGLLLVAGAIVDDLRDEFRS